MVRSSIWPGPGSGTSASTSLKASGVGSPRGRAARRIWRFFTAVMVSPWALPGSLSDDLHFYREAKWSVACGQVKPLDRQTRRHRRPFQSWGHLGLAAVLAVLRDVARQAWWQGA